MNNKEIQVCMANFRIKWDHSIRTRVCPNGHILFFCTKPRLSQARALLFPKVFMSLIKYKTKRRKIIKVHLSLCFVIKYTLSTPWKRKTPCKSAIYKGFVVPRPGLEPGWIAPLVFETSASTYSAIWAWFCRQNNRCKVREKIWMRQIFIRQNIRHGMIRHDFWYLNRKDLEV